ncbi:MAG: hypothetical protein K0S07_1304 [Chlamydiales bacterium]|jgi:hypothetical protein|nr:hypothetical protein [Chlamydiales bacterium]
MAVHAAGLIKVSKEVARNLEKRGLPFKMPCRRCRSKPQLIIELKLYIIKNEMYSN